jgi:hypothetical protein
MRAAVILAAFIFKYWLVYRMMTKRARAVAVLALLAILLGTLAWLQKPETKRFHEVICFDPAQRSPFNDYDLCEYKLRSAFGSFRPHEALIA